MFQDPDRTYAQRVNGWLHAHRGASGEAPENTMAAFRLGLEQGADGIELDIQLSCDGIPIVIHDPTLERSTGCTGNVAELTAAEITRLDTYESWARANGSKPRRGAPPWPVELTRVPALETVLAWLPADRGLVIDVKTEAAVPAVVRLLAGRRAAPGTTRLISFLPGAIDQARGLAAWLSTGLLLDEGDSLADGLAWAAQHGHASVVPYAGDLGGAQAAHLAVAAAAGNGLSIGTYVVNDAHRAEELLAAGVTFLMTDWPERLALARRRAM